MEFGEFPGSIQKPCVCRGCSSVLCIRGGTDGGEDAQGGCLVHLKTVGGRGGDLQGWARPSPILSDSALLFLACLGLTFDSFLSGKWPCLVTLIWVSQGGLSLKPCSLPVNSIVDPLPEGAEIA